MTSESTKSVCPDCGAELPPQAVLCVACGLNLKTGQKITSQVGAAPAAKPKSAAKASSSPKRGALVATLVAFVVLIAAVGGIVVMSQRSAGTSATPAGPLPEQVAAEWRASLATAMESAVCKSRLLTVKGPRLAAEPVAAALGTCSLLPILAEGLPPQSLVATVAFVGLDSSALPADPLEDTSDRSILRLNVQAGKGMVLFSREFQAEQPAIVDPVPGVPDSEVAEAEANRAAVETLVGEIPSLLVGLALASGKPSAKVLDEMEKWLKDEDASRRRAACLLFAAKPVRPKRVPLKLAELLTTADLEVRYAALAALGAYGGEAADTLPILTALLDDADPKTQSGARLVIASIKGGPGWCGLRPLGGVWRPQDRPQRGEGPEGGPEAGGRYGRRADGRIRGGSRRAGGRQAKTQTQAQDEANAEAHAKGVLGGRREGAFRPLLRAPLGPWLSGCAPGWPRAVRVGSRATGSLARGGSSGPPSTSGRVARRAPASLRGDRRRASGRACS